MFGNKKKNSVIGKSVSPAGSDPVLGLKCFVSRSYVGDSHAVYLSIDRSQGSDLRTISTHHSIVDAWRITGEGVTVSKKLKCLDTESNDTIVENFTRKLVEAGGNYPLDDSNYRPSGKNRILVPWLLQGGSVYDKDVPEGITFELVKKNRTSKKWKVFHRKLDLPGYDENGMFAVGFSDWNILSIDNTDETIITNTYIMAAFMADFLNFTNHTQISVNHSEFDRIRDATEKIFSIEIGRSNTAC